MSEQSPLFIKLLAGDGRHMVLAVQSDEEAEEIMKNQGFSRRIEIGASEYFAHIALARHGFIECFERHEAFNAARTNALLDQISALNQALSLVDINKDTSLEPVERR